MVEVGAEAVPWDEPASVSVWLRLAPAGVGGAAAGVRSGRLLLLLGAVRGPRPARPPAGGGAVWVRDSEGARRYAQAGTAGRAQAAALAGTAW